MAGRMAEGFSFFGGTVLTGRVCAVFVRRGREVVASLHGCKEVDLQAVLRRYSMACFAEIAFGLQEVPERFTQAFDRAQDLVNARIVDPLWKLKRFLRTRSERDYSAQLRVLNDFALDIVRLRRQHPPPTDQLDLLSFFSQALHPTSDEFLRDMIISFIIAGR